ncbi:hypothetical protein PspLS_06559 [Pyricularia sp. CBS 133598]|nr:hypothetical protein PspLS_06559 [Pyricularia sp. CBS 133598]
MRSIAILVAWVAAAAAPVSALQIPDLLRRQNTPSTPPASRQGNIVPVTVGSTTRDKSLRFYPDNVRAAIGDTIQFQFWPNNHTVTQAIGPENPCRPVEPVNGAEPPVNSGFIPGSTDGAPVGTFSMQVKSMDPMYLYCARAPHCALGMVMIVNPKNDADVETYRKAAIAKNETIYGNIAVAGGQVGFIPNNQAVPPPS